MKKQILVTALLTAGIICGSTHSGMAFKGMGESMGSSHDMNSAPKSDTGQPQSMVIEGHEGNRQTIVANVNGTPVAMGALMDSIREIMMTKYGNTEVTADIARTIRKDALEKLVLEELACQRAVDLGISVKPELIAKNIEARRAAAGGEEQFLNSLTQQNTTLQDLERQIERFYLIKQLIHKEIDSKINISEETLDETYEANKEQFVEPERVKISDIIFFLDPEETASEQKVLDIRAKIINELSGNPADLQADGVLVRNNLNVTAAYKPDLYKHSRELKPGTFSDPLLIDGTLHLVKLESYHPRKEQPKEEVKVYIASQMKSAEKSQRLPLWRHELLKEGKVEIVHEILK
jgi:peptidyl-prolyl cis-trans isomerase SurA